MLTPIIYRATPVDWRRVRAVRLRALAEAPDAFGSTLAEAQTLTDAQWRARLEDGNNATFLAIDQPGCTDALKPPAERTAVGMVVGFPWKGGSASDLGLFGMWVAPEARGRGVGSELIGALVSWARSNGYLRVFLDVADENLAAVALYERMGFTATGVTGTLPPPREHICEHQRVLEL